MGTGTSAALRGIIAKDYALAPGSLTPDTALKEQAIDSQKLIEPQVRYK